MKLFEALRTVTSGATLSEEQARATMNDIMGGETSSLQIAAMLGALRMRGETVQEITGFARALRDNMIPVCASSTRLVDTCGTGGDSQHGISTFNVSTAAAFIAAGAGAKIAKHGNRAQSSRCGSADVLEALGINLKLNAAQIARGIDEIGLGFMFAPDHHPAMRHVAPIRRELGVRTVFNLLGPLANPAGAHAQVMGVSDARWIRPIAEVLLALGTTHAIVAHSEDGLDEFSTCAKTHYIEVKDGELHQRVLDPHEFGVSCAVPQLLEGGDATRNAEIIQQLLHDANGATADIACLNAAAVLVIADISPNIEEGLKLSRASVNSGAAREKLFQMIEYSNAV
jgi:anthranilate phosphoribosyltransferase